MSLWDRQSKFLINKKEQNFFFIYILRILLNKKVPKKIAEILKSFLYLFYLR